MAIGAVMVPMDTPTLMVFYRKILLKDLGVPHGTPILPSGKLT